LKRSKDKYFSESSRGIIHPFHNPNHWVQSNNYSGLEGELNSLYYY